MVYVYGFPYYVKLTESPIIHKLRILQNNIDKTEIIEIFVDVIIKHEQSSIRDFIENGYQDCLILENVWSKMYVVSDMELNEQQITTLDSKLQGLYIDLKIDKPKKISYIYQYRMIEQQPSLMNAIETYDNITIHYPDIISDDYVYYNVVTPRKQGCIESNDDRINYRLLEKRQTFSSIHGILNTIDGSVDIFNYFPLVRTTNVYVLGPEWFIVPGTQQVAVLQIDSMVFWLITRDSFISKTNNVCVLEDLKYNTFNANRLNLQQLDAIQNVFTRYNFTNLSSTEHRIMGMDNNLIMYIGVCDEEELGTYSSSLAQFY